MVIVILISWWNDLLYKWEDTLKFDTQFGGGMQAHVEASMGDLD